VARGQARPQAFPSPRGRSPSARGQLERGPRRGAAGAAEAPPSSRRVPTTWRLAGLSPNRRLAWSRVVAEMSGASRRPQEEPSPRSDCLTAEIRTQLATDFSHSHHRQEKPRNAGSLALYLFFFSAARMLHAAHGAQDAHAALGRHLKALNKPSGRVRGVWRGLIKITSIGPSQSNW